MPVYIDKDVNVGELHYAAIKRPTHVHLPQGQERAIYSNENRLVSRMILLNKGDVLTSNSLIFSASACMIGSWMCFSITTWGVVVNSLNFKSCFTSGSSSSRSILVPLALHSLRPY